MRILYYNWVQFDNKKNIGGGVNIYQKNLIDYLVKNTDNELYFLSSGWKYNPFKNITYIKKTNNIYEKKCKTFEIINSTVMSPTFSIYMNPKLFLEDMGSYEILDKFITEYGPFDVIHFNNIEGISINVLKLKEKYPRTKFIVSIHNYQLICPLVQYYQNHKNCICKDFDNGNDCLKCSLKNPTRKEYVKKCRNYFTEKLPHFLKFPCNVISKIFKYKAERYIGSKLTMSPDLYKKYREYNVEILNKYADAVLAVSNRVKEIMFEYGVNKSILYTSYIGTKFAESEMNCSIASVTKPFTVAYLGYARIDKGFYFFIDALSQLDEKIAKKMNVLLAVQNINNIELKGKLDNFNKVIKINGYKHEQLKEMLKDVNLGVVPVLWEDNLPQVAIEMVANGVPILCSSFGGASELCNSDLFKFQGGNEKDFISKMLEFVENPNMLNEYWKNHKPLMTMKKHIEELNIIYTKE